MASFTVENGSGLAAANSYVTIAEADDYIDNLLRNDSNWTSKSDATKERYLREGTQSIELIYGERWRGHAAHSTQGLDWPRAGVVDDDGWSRGSDVVPEELKRATIEAAWKHLNDSGPSTTTGDSTGIIPDISKPGTLREESVSVGSVKSKKVYYGQSQLKWLRKISLILKTITVQVGSMERG